MTIEKKLLGTNPVSGEVLPEAVSFDGTNDYLLRTSDMTNNADGKTFTFSCWVYWTDESSSTVFTTTNSFHVLLDTGGNNELHVTANNSSGTKIFDVKLVNGSSHAISKNTWSHLLLSIDLANTSNRFVYINDVLFSSVWVTYTNDTIDFTSTKHAVGGYINTVNGSVQANFKGRLAHVFLDYTYRDLSTTSNRRLFIDADGKPSSTIPSNPILYLPMKDAATAGSNSGTGGDFTVNGVLATAERGPNQDNCSASTFDGSNDYLSSSSSISLGNKTITFSCIINSADLDKGGVLQFSKNSDERFNLYLDGHPTSGEINIAAKKTSSGNDLLHVASLGCYKVGQNVHIAFSCDMSDTSKRQLFINGVAKTNVQYGQYFNDNFATDINTAEIGKLGSTNFKGSAGEVYLNNTYTDLATENPFWDSDANRPNSVRKVIEDTGVTPLLALPIVGSDAGNNLGSGGDFTVNSGPFTGARGGSEFWARSVKFSNAETQYLNMTSPSATSGKTFTLVMLINHSTGDNGEATIAFSNSSNIVYFTVESNTSNIKIFGRNSSGSTILSGQIDGISRRQNQWDIYLISGDMTNASKFKIYFNGVNKSIASGDWSTFTNDTLGLASSTHVNIGRSNATSGQFLTGEIGNVYFSNEYTDFSQEVNRNKFIDQLGFPADLGADGSNPSGNQPYIYATMPSSNLGKNAGSGPDFTPVASPIAGEDFIPS